MGAITEPSSKPTLNRRHAHSWFIGPWNRKCIHCKSGKGRDKLRGRSSILRVRRDGWTPLKSTRFCSRSSLWAWAHLVCCCD